MSLKGHLGFKGERGATGAVGTPKKFKGTFREFVGDSSIDTDYHYIIVSSDDTEYNGHWVYFDEDSRTWRDGGNYGEINTGIIQSVAYNLQRIGSQIILTGSDGSFSSIEDSASGGTTYHLSKSGSTVTLTGSDGSVTSIDISGNGSGSVSVLSKTYTTQTGSQNTFSMPAGYINGNYVQVFVNGMKLLPSEYTINGDILSLTNALDVIGTNIEIVVFQSTSMEVV